MPKASLLTTAGKSIILALQKNGISDIETAPFICHHPETVCRFLKHPSPVPFCSGNPPNQKYSERDVLHIVKMEITVKWCAEEISDARSVIFSICRIQQTFSGQEFLKNWKPCKAPYMIMRYKIDSLLLARKILEFYAVNCKSLLFTDEKKMNSDKHEWFRHYWLGINHEPAVFSLRQRGGYWVMDWGAICYLATLLIGVLKYFCTQLTTVKFFGGPQPHEYNFGYDSKNSSYNFPPKYCATFMKKRGIYHKGQHF